MQWCHHCHFLQKISYPADAHNGYNTNIAYQALPHSSPNTSMKDENAAAIDTKLIASRQSDSSILGADCTNIVKLEPGDSFEYEIKFSEQKKIFSNQNCDDMQNYWYNAFDNMEQPSIDIKEEILFGKELLEEACEPKSVY